MLNTCSKDEIDDIVIEESFEEAILHEALTEEEDVFWESQESITLSAEDILLPNGLTIAEFKLIDAYKKSTGVLSENPVDLKNRLIQEMGEEAILLTTRSNFNYPALDYDAPAQTGLAYSYGSRNHTIRQNPPIPIDGSGCASEKIYGLDCSGFVYRLFLKAGIDLNTNAGTWADLQRQPHIISTAIKKAYPDHYEYFKVEDLGKIDDLSEFKTGDIIYWREIDENSFQWRARHIGMVLKRPDGSLAIAQSNGSGYSNCVANYTSTKKGPRFCTLEWSIKPKAQFGFGDNYCIVRISATTSPPNFNGSRAMVKVYGYYHESHPEGSRDYESDNGAIQTADKYTGSFQENVFQGVYSKTVYTVNYSGQITAFFNADFDVVEWLWFSEDVTGPEFVHSESFVVTNIPYAWADIYQVEGETSCAHINDLTNVQTSPTGLNYNLKNYDCTWKSKVYISFTRNE